MIILLFLTFSLISKAKSLAKTDDTDDQIQEGIENLEDHLPNLSEHFLVFKATSCEPLLNCSLVVCRQSCSSIDPARLEITFDGIITALAVHDVGIMINCGDGATENISFFDSSCTENLKGFISDSTAEIFKKFNLEEHLDFLIAMKDPILKKLSILSPFAVFLIEWRFK